MEDYVRGVTIRNTMDNSQVDRGFAGLRRQLGLANSELKANMSAFDKSEKSMHKYQTRLSGLNKNMKIQKQMFNQAESELKQVNSRYAEAKQRVGSVEKAYKSLTEANKKNKVALDRSNESLKESNAELKKQQAQYKRTTESKEKAYVKLKQLRQAEKDLKNSNQATTAQLKRANEATQRQANKHKELVQKYKDEGAQLSKLKGQNNALATSNGKVRASYDKTNTELSQTEKEFNDLNKTIKDHDKNLTNAQKKVNAERTSMNNLQKTIGRTESEMKAFNKEQLIANSHYTKTANHLDTMSGKFGKVGSSMTSMGRSMSVGVTTPLTLGLGAAVKKSADFEEQMSKVGAVSQASGSQLKAMSNEAVQLGAKTSKSASEVAEGMNELAQLGFNAKQVMAAMPGVISAAEASGADMATTATVMASSINSFNLKASQSGHVADVLATAANDSAADISYMGDALKYAGTPAHSLGMSLEDTSASIEVMSNAGLKGEQAGTTLRASLIRLAKPTKQSQQAMDQLGISLTDSKGKFVGMPKLIGQFKDGLQGMTKQQKLAAVAQVVGTESASGFLSLINAGPKKLDKYSKSLKNSDGASAKTAKQMRDNLKGALEQLGGAFESLGIQVGNDLTPILRGAAGVVQKFVQGFSSMPGWVRKGAIGLGIFAAATGPVLIATGLMIGAVGKAAKGYAALNRQMAVNTAEAAVNAGANKAAAGSLATTGKVTKGHQSTLGKMGNVLTTVTGRYGKLGSAVRIAGKVLSKAALPVTILTTVLGLAYTKLDWFRKGVSDFGKLWGQTFGHMDFSWVGKFGSGIAKGYDKLKGFSAKLLGMTPQFQLIKKEFGLLHKAVSKTTDTTNVLGKGISKGTKKALGAYTDLSQKSKVKFEQIRISHKKIGDKEYNQVKSLYGSINREVSKQMNKRHDSEVKGLQKIFKRTSGLSKSEEGKILENTKRHNRKESKEAKNINNQIVGIYAKAHRERRSLTAKENAKVASLQRKLDRTVVKSLSKGAIEQKAILERLKQNKGKLSMQAASRVIKESAKERDKSISSAKKKYKDTVAEAVKQRDVTGNLSKKQADKVIKDAKKQYNESKKNAKKQHRDVVDQAQKQNKGVKKNIDAQTGHVKSKWEVMRDTSVGKAKSIAKGTVKWFKDMHKGAKIWWGAVGRTIADKSKGSKNSSNNNFKGLVNTAKGKFKDLVGDVKSKWGKIKNHITDRSKDSKNSSNNNFKGLVNTAKGKFKDLLGDAKSKWNSIKNNISDRSKDSKNHSNKNFGDMANTAKNKFKDMLSKAKDNFNKIFRDSDDKGKKTHGKWKEWLNKTLNFIKNIKKDFGNAASDLGKTVANKAVDGLNGMIGGINKIAKAITDKTLIKPIPHLSTGTYDGSKVATNADGGLKQSTLAVVNDRGKGNAPGGGYQEVIERADGSLHAPQGRNVVVPLGVGDRVHNATDTKRYQDMGMLPRFASGTKKKENDYLKHPLKALFSDGKKGAAVAKKTAKDTSKNVIKKTKEVGTDALEKAEDAAMGIWGGIKGVTKDVGEFLDHPGKLVDKVMEKIGVNFGSGANATVKMARGAYGKLKKALVEKVKTWFEESGGDGDGGYIKYLDNITTPYSPNGPPPGYAFNWPHPGIDLPYHYEPVYSTINGTAHTKEMPGGFGHYIQVHGGALDVIYGHLSKWLVKEGQKVHPGTKLGISGNTGASTGPHLHYEMHQNGKPINPIKWLKSHNGSKGGKGESYARSVIQKAQRILGGKYKGSYILNNMMKLAKRESTYDASAVNNWDSNAKAGHPSKGLFQMIDTTFRANAKSGYSNFSNPVHQAISAMRYIQRTYGWGGFPRAAAYAYENGGMVTKHQVAEIGEGNKPEMVVPLTKRNRAIQLIEQAMRYVGMDSGSTNVTVNNDNSTMEKLLQQLVRVNDHNNRLTQTLIEIVKAPTRNGNPKDAEKILSNLMGERAAMTAFNQGG